jgi:two-component system OmpR family response regulator
MKTRVLVVDDESHLADLVATALRYEGFEAATAGNGAAAVQQVADFRPDLIVMDVMLPDASGIDTTRRLRDAGNRAPVVFLTSHDATEDKAAGPTVGGDDYVTKPFSLEELVARIRAVLRRTAESHTSAQGGTLVFADLEIDDEAHEVRRHGVAVDLTPTEFKLLRYLTAHAGRVLTKRQILDHVWEYGFGGGDTVVQTYISCLRRKIDSVEPALIQTVPRIGYVMRVRSGGSGGSGDSR